MPEALQLAIRHHKSPRQTVKLHSSDVVSGTVRKPTARMWQDSFGILAFVVSYGAAVFSWPDVKGP